MAFNLPDGCSVGDLPGFRESDMDYYAAENRFENMDVDEQIDILESICSEVFLDECVNEAMMDDDDYDEDVWVNYTEATDSQLCKMVDYIWGIERFKEDIIEHIMEGY